MIYCIRQMELIFLERQFERVKEGDRFFFTHKDEAGSFTTAAKEIFLGRTLKWSDLRQH